MSDLFDRAERGPADFVSARLQPGEHIEEILPDATGGPSPSFLALIAVILILIIPNYSLVMTDRRLLLIGRSKLTGRPTRLERELQRDKVKVVSYERGNLWSVLRLADPQQAELKLNVRRAVRGYADDLVRALDPTWTF